MIAFICNKRPRSINAKGTATFQAFIQAAFARYCPGASLVTPTYGRVYYFRRVAHQLDADNLSKPILDALKGHAYADDSIVELRSSGIIDLRSNDISAFDLTRVPPMVIDDFVDSIGSADHVIYVELGDLTMDMFAFG